jgi:hypothetical protein
MDMNRWKIEWYPEDGQWEISYCGDGVTVAAHYDRDYVKQDPIDIYLWGGQKIREPWPWSHDTSPSPIRVMKRLCKLAEMHRPGNETTPVSR